MAQSQPVNLRGARWGGGIFVASSSACRARATPWIRGRPLALRALPCALLAALGLGSLGAAELLVEPSALSLTGLDPEHGLLVSLVDDAGRHEDVTDRVALRSSAPTIVEAGPGPRVLARGEGRAEVRVEHAGFSAMIWVGVSRLEMRPPPSFREDVLPLLTRASCNSGACHGKLAGQNGFRLSLRGYAPERDHEWITTEYGGRRIELGAPSRSLLLMKAQGVVPHDGGTRLEANSRGAELLRRWIEARAPGPLKDDVEARPASLELLPSSRLARAGDTQRLLVRARYPDGRARDVTWLSLFYSNDSSVVEVSEAGLARALRPGETVLRAHFRGLVAVAHIAIPYEREVDPALFVERRGFIDEAVFSKLEALRIPPSGPCDDATFLRRVYLDAIGVLPEPEEAVAFMADASAGKRERLIDQVLERPEWAEYWALQLADLFQNRKERDHDVRGTKGVRAFHAWLLAQLSANRSWSDIATAVLTAKGSVREAPQVGYFITTLGERDQAADSELPDSAAQALLGTRIGCARCHNHPLERYTQDDFYRFAAFFGRTGLDRKAPADGDTELRVESREERDIRRDLERWRKELAGRREKAAASAGNGKEPDEGLSKAVEEGERRVTELESRIVEAARRRPRARQPRTGEEVEPRALDGSSLELEPAGDPREALARWMVDPRNEVFAGAMVNRIWRHLLGVGLVEPVDDLRASNPPTNQELWTGLCRHFVACNFDLKALLREVLRSRVYQLSSATLPENRADDRFFSHYQVKRLPAEVLMDAVSQVTGVPERFPGYPLGLRAVQVPDPGVGSYFLSLFGRSDRVTACACERKEDITLPQLLHLYTGEELLQKTQAPEGRLARLLESAGDGDWIGPVYLLALTRPPAADERAEISRLLEGAPDRKVAAADLLWALLNSKEFTFHH